MAKTQTKNSAPNNITRIRTSVKAFIVHNGKVLIVKERVREKGETSVIHDIPGGGIEIGETLREALTREVMEEVGLKVEIHHPVGAWEFTYFKPDEGLHIVCIGFHCTLVGEPTIDTTKNPVKSEDIFETLWLTKEEILASDQILRNADMRKALEQVRI